MADSEGIGSSGSNVVGEEIRELMKKLALWQTEPSSIITTHTELEPILENLGFSRDTTPPAEPPHGAVVQWQTYTFLANSRWRNRWQREEQPPIVKLPYPKFDGLHELAYTDFLDALSFYLELDDDKISSIFHVRIMDVSVSELEDTNWKIERSKEKHYMYKPASTSRAEIESVISKLFGDDDDADAADNNEDDDSALVRWRSPATSSTAQPPKK